MRRGAIRGLLDGFLGTFVSRYSDYDGWWLMGFLVGRESPVELDLLAPPPSDPLADPLACAADVAQDRFADQLAKWKVPIAHVVSATLTGETVRGTLVPCEGRHEQGSVMRWTVCVRTATGQASRLARDVHVALHDPELESRRLPGKSNLRRQRLRPERVE